MQGIQPRLGDDGDQPPDDFGGLARRAPGDEIGQGMGDGGGAAAVTARRDQREHHLVEEVVQPLAPGVARVVPGAAVPQPRLAAGHLGVPLVPFHAEVVLPCDAVAEHRIVEEAVILEQGAAIQHQPAGFAVHHLAAVDQVELPVVRPLGGAGIEAVTLGDQPLVLDLLGVLEHVGEGVAAVLDAPRQVGDVGIRIADGAKMRDPAEQRARFGVLGNAPHPAVPRHDRPQIGKHVAERPSGEIDVILDRPDQPGVAPHRDVLVPGHDQMRPLARLDGEGERLAHLLPRFRAGPRLAPHGDGDVAAFDLQLLIQDAGGERDALDAVAFVDVGIGPDQDLDFARLGRGRRKQQGGRGRNDKFLHAHRITSPAMRPRRAAQSSPAPLSTKAVPLVSPAAGPVPSQRKMR